MRRRINVIVILMTLFWGVMSCKNEADPQADKSFFTRFYDDANFNVAYTPLDVAQTSDGGYLVLALKRPVDPEGKEVNRGLIYILKTDAFGGFVSDLTLEETLGTPAPSLVTLNGKHYFFCMDISTFGIQLMEVGEDGTIAQQMDVSGSYPLAAGSAGNELLLLNFDAGARTTIMSVISPENGQPLKSKAFAIGAADGGPYAPEAVIMDHINKQGKQMPFFVGKTTNDLYFFNGIYNYGLSIVFTDLNAANPIGVINGFNDDGGMSALYSLNGGKFAAARFNFGDNYLMPSISLNSTGLSQADDAGGYSFPELTPNAPVIIESATINNTEKILFGSNTRGKQIALFGYNPADGSLVGSRYIGFSNAFELASIAPTADDGLVVLGTTYIAGRFPRICLFKLSAESLGKSFK